MSTFNISKVRKKALFSAICFISSNDLSFLKTYEPVNGVKFDKDNFSDTRLTNMKISVHISIKLFMYWAGVLFITLNCT